MLFHVRKCPCWTENNFFSFKETDFYFPSLFSVLIYGFVQWFPKWGACPVEVTRRFSQMEVTAKT